ncbi:MAG TPA: alkaline phosphatase family protein [Acidimicrobiales bacterium]|nr:alkaline phosphatase family protein [Acidimicrobiales bacterium]
MDRRTFMKGALAGAGAAAVGAPRAASASPVNLALPSLGLTPPTARTPVEHLVVVMMENRSVNHYLGWYGKENREFDGIQDASFPDLRQGEDGPLVPTEAWGQAGRGNFHGRGFADPSHGWTGGRAERHGGTCDGWLHPVTGNDELALSYYDADDIPVWARLVRDYQAYDRWFCSLLGPTQPNRYYLHSAQSGGLKNNDLPPERAQENSGWALGWDWPTVWTLADTYGLTARYYYSNLPQIAFWGARHLHHASPVAEFYAAAATGTLPQLSIIDPWFIAPSGISNDDHPHADIRLGQAFISDIVEAFATSPCYQKAALVVTYDEWGGFWDHVPPPRLPDDRGTPDDPAGEDDFGQLGFRIPSAIMSPWTRTRPGKTSRVDHTVYDHASILRFVSENWGLPYLTLRHRSTNSIERAFRRFKTFDPEPSYTTYDAPPALLVEPYQDDPLGQLEQVPGAPDLPDVTPDGGPAPVPNRVAAPAPPPPAPEGSDLHRLAELGWFERLPVDTDLRFEDSYLHRRPDLLVSAAAEEATRPRR